MRSRRGQFVYIVRYYFHLTLIQRDMIAGSKRRKEKELREANKDTSIGADDKLMLRTLKLS